MCVVLMGYDGRFREGAWWRADEKLSESIDGWSLTNQIFAQVFNTVKRSLMTHSLNHLFNCCLIQIEGHLGRLTLKMMHLYYYKSHACMVQALYSISAGEDNWILAIHLLPPTVVHIDTSSSIQLLI